jgi:hypothetical protein
MPSNADKKAMSLEQRFWPKVRQTPDCWLWTGSKCSDGYGTIGTSKGYLTSAHRLSWIIHNGPIPKGLSVLHKCDNPPCVNPKHLFLGTQRDNIIDCVNKRRDNKACGSRHPNAKLTESLVKILRQQYKDGTLNAKAKARELRMQYMTICHMLWGWTWKHVK